MPIRVEHVVEGGPVKTGGALGERGVVVGHQTRQGRLAMTRPMQDEHGEDIVDAQGKRQWVDREDEIQGIILLRKGEQSIPALTDVMAKIDELNDTPGRLLPGVQHRALL